jgi:hypothetical protein
MELLAVHSGAMLVVASSMEELSGRPPATR